MPNLNLKKILLQNKNKKLFFLVAMPRSGNTLFASIMNQNPDVVCTANSITLEILKELFLLKYTDVFKNFPDNKSLNNVMDSVFDLYYKDWKQKYIIDRGPVMTPNNFKLVTKHFGRSFKCIVLIRNLIDVLASYIKWYTENPNAFPNKYGKTDEEKLSHIMHKEGAVAKELDAIKNAYNYPQICHFISYDNLISNTKKEIIKVYNFLDIPYYNKHYYSNLKQININNISYDDSVVGDNMHNIKPLIKKEYNPYIEKIPQRIIKKYEHIKF
jgi:hypothetical protein